MFTKIKIDSNNEFKVGQKRKIQTKDEFAPIKLQKLEIKDEHSCNEEKFKCDICELVCKNKSGLSNHKNTHLTDKEKQNPECFVCKQKFETRHLLQMHIQNKHTNFVF